MLARKGYTGDPQSLDKAWIVDADGSHLRSLVLARLAQGSDDLLLADHDLGDPAVGEERLEYAVGNDLDPLMLSPQVPRQHHAQHGEYEVPDADLVRAHLRGRPQVPRRRGAKARSDGC